MNKLNFKDLGLSDKISNLLMSLKYKNPTDVQKEIIPLSITGKNIVFISHTGSGKTLAYSAGFLTKINPKQNIQILILAPTRELSIQIGKELIAICENLAINVGVLYGGRDIKGDFKTTSKKIQILVGTPGRIIQHVNEKNIKIGDVKYLVFDESDQMFDNGSYDECVYAIKRSSKNVY
jgi:ATP-dependent RNA helicase DeaD